VRPNQHSTSDYTNAPTRATTNFSTIPWRDPLSERERQAPIRARSASDEKTVRTPFQKFHGLRNLP
jgi:hypothetical protein